MPREFDRSENDSYGILFDFSRLICDNVRVVIKV